MSAPKPPSPKKVNPYEGMTSDPDFYAAAQQLGINSVDKDSEVRRVREQMIKNTAEAERNSKSFRRAEKQLYKEGILTKEKGQKRQDATNSDFELQKIYDRQYDNEAAKADRQYQKSIDKQTAKYEKQQKQAQKQAQAQFDKQMAAQKESQDAMAAQQKELMEQMMNQPVYSAKQAALPAVQYQPETPDPMPVAPAPPPAMNIQSAPPPELTNIGNQMSIVRQSSTAKQRSRRRTRGTSTLRN